jgi:hypothetical protein
MPSTGATWAWLEVWETFRFDVEEIPGRQWWPSYVRSFSSGLGLHPFWWGSQGR